MTESYCVYSGFDSAWTANNQGAIASIRIRGKHSEFIPPQLANFASAPALLARHRDAASMQIVAIDQPLIVRNQNGRRPVEKAVAHLMGRSGGGIQPANRSRQGMFDDSAPIWRFLDATKGELDPIKCLNANAGVYFIEVYPSLGTLGLCRGFYKRGRVAKYNPLRKKTFRIRDWQNLCDESSQFASGLGLTGVDAWLKSVAGLPKPTKHDQDRLDATLCALYAFNWRRHGLEQSTMVGDSKFGYMITPSHTALDKELITDAARHGVPVLSRTSPLTHT